MFNSKTILITGGTGSFGSTCVQYLLKKYKPKKVRETKEKFFIYQPKYKNNKVEKKSNKNNPFGKLSELRFR